MKSILSIDLQEMFILILLNFVENEYWEYNSKSYKESNWKAIVDDVHIMQVSLLWIWIGNKFKTSETKCYEYELEISSTQVEQNVMNMNWK